MMRANDEVHSTTSGTGHIHSVIARDWIAVVAMQGILAGHQENWTADSQISGLAETAYKVADAMLKQSERPG
jgi:hypothetical protein